MGDYKNMHLVSTRYSAKGELLNFVGNVSEQV